MDYRALMKTLPVKAGWEWGDDPKNPGRFYAQATWMDHEAGFLTTFRAENEDSYLAAVQSVIEEYDHCGRDLPR